MKRGPPVVAQVRRERAGLDAGVGGERAGERGAHPSEPAHESERRRRGFSSMSLLRRFTRRLRTRLRVLLLRVASALRGLLQNEY